MSHRILIVDDDPLFGAAIRHWLEERDYHPLLATNPTEALTAFTEHKPHLVLLDMVLGEEDALPLLTTMHTLRPSIPILVVSSKDAISTIIEAFKAGAQDYVLKPIPSLELFAQSIANCLERVRIQQSMQATHARLYTLVQNLPIILFSFTQKLEFSFLSKNTEQVLGYTPGELHNYPLKFLHLIHKEDRKKLLKNIGDIFADLPYEPKMEFRFTHKNGYPVILQIHFIAQKHEDESQRVEGILIDITRHAYLDTLALLNERQLALLSLAQEVAHEIRNPLVAVGGLARHLRQMHPHLVELDLLIQECQRLDGVWERLDPLLEPEPAALAPMNLTAAIAFICRILSDQLERSNLHVILDAAPQIPLVSGSVDLTQRALLVLFQYAKQALEPGASITIRIFQEDAHAALRATLTPLRQGTGTIQGPQLLDICRRLILRQGGRFALLHENNTSYIHIHLPIAPSGLAAATDFS